MSPTRATAVRAAPGAIVFTDIAGFTEFTAVRGDEAALALLALQERFDREATAEELPLWVRMGVHYGQPAQRGDDLVGHDVNVASRIVELAAPGEVLASEAAVRRIGDGLPDVVFEEVGPVVMKGIPAPIALYRALRA